MTEQSIERARDSTCTSVVVVQPADVRDGVDGIVAIFYGTRLGRVAV